MAQEAKTEEVEAAAKGCALVIGFGEGMGRSLAMRFASAGYNVALVGRTKEKLANGVSEIGERYPKIAAMPFVADTSDEEQCKKAFAEMSAAQTELGRIEVLLFNASIFIRKSFLETTLDDFERSFAIGAKGLFIWSKLVIPDMLSNDAMTSILVSGATAALKGSANCGCFASNKFAMRALTQSLAREFGPQGIHCAHFILDGMILGKKEEIDSNANGTKMNPNDIADAYYFVHTQSPSAWVQEMDMRPKMEKF